MKPTKLCRQILTTKLTTHLRKKANKTPKKPQIKQQYTLCLETTTNNKTTLDLGAIHNTLTQAKKHLQDCNNKNPKYTGQYLIIPTHRIVQK